VVDGVGDDEDGTYLIIDRTSGDTVSVFFRDDARPGWWRGHLRGVPREVFLPGMAPAQVAARFLRG
jgi:hypothetical protein